MFLLTITMFLGLTVEFQAADVKVLYVLPNNLSNDSCPSQPCATLSRYLLDNNGAFPVVSNVEYHFLPGEHLLTSTLVIENAFNFSMVAYVPAMIRCSPVSHVAIFHSSNVTIQNFTFNGCRGIACESLSIHSCVLCRLSGIVFLQYGFVGTNLLWNSLLDNITIKANKMHESGNCQGSGIALKYSNVDTHPRIDFITISNAEIIGIDGKGVDVKMEQDAYNMNIMVMNSSFHEIQNGVVRIYVKNFDFAANTVLIKSCLFVSNNYGAVVASVPRYQSTFNVIKCNFVSNQNVILVHVTDGIRQFRQTLTRIMIKDNNFINNTEHVLNISAQYYYVQVYVYLSGFINIHGTKAKHMQMISAYNMIFIVNGSIEIANNLADKVMVFESCDVLFSKNITLRDNTCTELIALVSQGFLYITIMEFTNLTIIDNKSPNYPITVKSYGNFYTIFPYPPCLFQYTTNAKQSKRVFVSPSHYTIAISVKSIARITPKNLFPLLLTSHCGWLNIAAVYGYNSGSINREIIIQQGIIFNLKYICYCSRNGTADCDIDVLGPIYPGQQLKVHLCKGYDDDRDDIGLLNNSSSEILFAETHSIYLPASACKIAHQNELVQSMVNYKYSNNFTIISEVYDECELFLTAEPYLHRIYSAFYVKLMRCPAGFTLQSGSCNCDPILDTHGIHIDTCDIDQSAIHRPANTWVVHTNSNDTRYVASNHCPMDYCLPHSSHLNLLHPDLQCQFNRTGILCSQCQHSLSMVFGSSRCIHCTDMYILISMIVVVAGIALVVLLYLLNLTVTNGTITGIIFYANIISINDSVFLVNDNNYI